MQDFTEPVRSCPKTTRTWFIDRVSMKFTLGHSRRLRLGISGFLAWMLLLTPWQVSRGDGVVVRPLTLQVIDASTKKPVPGIEVLYQITISQPKRFFGIPHPVEPEEVVAVELPQVTGADGFVVIPARVQSLGWKQWMDHEYLLVNISMQECGNKEYSKLRKKPTRLWRKLQCIRPGYSGVFAVTSDGVIEKASDRSAVPIKGGMMDTLYFDHSLSKKSEWLVIEIKPTPNE